MVQITVGELLFLSASAALPLYGGNDCSHVEIMQDASERLRVAPVQFLVTAVIIT